VARFLSDQWVREMAEAAEASAGLAEATRGLRLVVQQVVEGPDGAAWWVGVDDGTVTVAPGAAEAPDVTLTTDAATAAALARGDLATQDAFAEGRLRIGGDLLVLIRHAGVLAKVEDAFADVRRRTTH
jgi:putative sterol carrier protein